MSEFEPTTNHSAAMPQHVNESVAQIESLLISLKLSIANGNTGTACQLCEELSQSVMAFHGQLLDHRLGEVWPSPNPELTRELLSPSKGSLPAVARCPKGEGVATHPHNQIDSL